MDLINVSLNEALEPLQNMASYKQFLAILEVFVPELVKSSISVKNPVELVVVASPGTEMRRFFNQTLYLVHT